MTALRRNRTRQRDRLLELLRGTDTHPTASLLYEQLSSEFPRLSLGTVYRNLEVLVADGVVEELESSGSAIRYDGNPTPHHHFFCDACGSIHDVELREPRGLKARLERGHGLRAERVRMSFYGLCDDCSDL